MVGYGNRSQSLKINIDDAANDGATDVAFTEGDNVHTDVEQVIGGAGNDDIQGSAARTSSRAAAATTSCAASTATTPSRAATATTRSRAGTATTS